MTNLAIKTQDHFKNEDNEIMQTELLTPSQTTQEEKTIFVRHGDEIHLSTFNPNEKRIFALSPGFYSLEYNDKFDFFYLRIMELQKMPSRLYGDVKTRSNRIINTFMDRQCNTGVLLEGMKGTGKSLLARQICLDAVEKGMPIIFISRPYSGPKFTAFMESLEQQCVINIDEFEKTYGSEDGSAQNGLLSLMDGVSKQNKLWVLTVNNTNRVNQYMMNRPGRIFYKITYGVISPEVVEEVAIDKGLSKAQTDNLLSIYSLIYELTFDVLMAIIEECKRYNEMPVEAIKLMNVSYGNTSILYDPTIELRVNGESILSMKVERWNTEHPFLYLNEHNKQQLNVLEQLSRFRKDFAENYEMYQSEAQKHANGEDNTLYELDFTDEEGNFRPQLYDYSEFELELVRINGRKNIREYKFVDMNMEGVESMEGKKMQDITIFVIPKKEVKKDYTSFTY